MRNTGHVHVCVGMRKGDEEVALRPWAARRGGASDGLRHPHRSRFFRTLHIAIESAVVDNRGPAELGLLCVRTSKLWSCRRRGLHAPRRCGLCCTRSRGPCQAHSCGWRGPAQGLDTAWSAARKVRSGAAASAPWNASPAPLCVSLWVTRGLEKCNIDTHWLSWASGQHGAWAAEEVVLLGGAARSPRLGCCCRLGFCLRFRFSFRRRCN